MKTNCPLCDAANEPKQMSFTKETGVDGKDKVRMIPVKAKMWEEFFNEKLVIKSFKNTMFKKELNEYFPKIEIKNCIRKNYSRPKIDSPLYDKKQTYISGPSAPDKMIEYVEVTRQQLENEIQNKRERRKPFPFILNLRRL